MIDRVISALSNSNYVAIYTHINTDCDAIGSSLALRDVLISLGKKADIFVNSAFPNNFKFYGDLSFVNTKTCDEKYDTAVCLDLPNELRLGKYRFKYKKNVKTTICIDHHVLSNEKFCKINFVKEASSTAEILFGIFKKMKVKLSNFACKCLLSGIITDTGVFTHTTTKNTFFVASKLLEIGKIKIEDVTTPLLNSTSNEVFELMKRAYSKIEFYSDSKLGIIMFSRNDFIETNTTLDDLDVFPDIPLKLEKVQFAILASEDEKGYFRVSFRSKGELSAKNVANVFGGGGHLNASGCKIFGEYADVKQKLIDSVMQTFGWEKWIWNQVLSTS